MKQAYRSGLLAGALCIAGIAPTAQAAGADGEAAASALLDRIAGDGAQLRIFLQAMPKGGDLHNHLGGNVYAEDLLNAAAGKGQCADSSLTRIVAGPCPQDLRIPHMAERNPFAYARLVDALSTRGYQRGTGPALVSGHAQFFSSFDKFEPAAEGQDARWIADALASAGRNSLVYLELMHNPPTLSRYIAGAPTGPLDEAGLAAALDRDAPQIAPVVAAARAELDREEAEVRQRLGCDTGKPDPGCTVVIRYLFSGLRGVGAQGTWRSLLAGFALAQEDPRVVGVNIVMPEDDPVALRDYGLHMAMFRVLHARYPAARIAMHAGELALGLVPPKDMADHIARAVAAGAARIGHGTSIAYEAAAAETLADMADRKIAVEVNLTSNAVILGVEGAAHPLRLYRARGVPVMLSTDDEGILRSDMTNEHMRAVQEQGMRYVDLKDMARNSLEYAFLPGGSVWRSGDYTNPVAQCQSGFASTSCQGYLATSQKAQVQARLELNFDQFETSLDRLGFAPAR